jgi:hypothetical protein
MELAAGIIGGLIGAIIGALTTDLLSERRRQRNSRLEHRLQLYLDALPPLFDKGELARRSAKEARADEERQYLDQLWGQLWLAHRRAMLAGSKDLKAFNPSAVSQALKNLRENHPDDPIETDRLYGKFMREVATFNHWVGTQLAPHE